MGLIILWLGTSGLALAIIGISRRARRRKFITAFRQLQLLVAAPLDFREATPVDSKLFARVSETLTSEAQQTLEHLGDVVIWRSEHSSAARVFVDETRTLLVFIESGGTLSAESNTDTLELRTGTSQQTYWSRPPFAMGQILSGPASVTQLLTAHREWVRAVVADDDLRHFATLADAIRTWEDVRDRERAWRSTQDPEQLMKDDLRVLTGTKADVLWRYWGPQLRDDLPPAKLRLRAPSK